MTLLGDIARRAAPPLFGSGSGLGTIPGIAQTSGGLVWLNRARSGVTVTYETAPELTAFNRCVNIIATACASFPLHVYTDALDPKGRAYPVATRSPFDAMLWGMPNPEHVPMVFWRLVFGHLASAGNAYLYLPRAANALPTEMWPLSPHRVRPTRLHDGRKVYLVDDKHALTDFMDGGEIIHVPGFGYDGLRGYNPVMLGADALGIAKAAESYAAGVFVNGAAPGGTIQTDQKLTKPQADAIRERWEQLHQGVDRAHKVAILDAGAKFETVSLDPQTSQLLETRKFQVTEIARMFGVPPHLVGDVERSTSWGTGIEEQGRGFVTYTLVDYYLPVEQAITFMLLAGTPRYAKFNTGALMRGAMLQRYQAHEIAIRSRFESPNEARALEELPPYAGGDDYYIQPGQVAVTEKDDVNDNANGNPNPADDLLASQTLAVRAEIAGVLVRAGYTAQDARRTAGLPEMADLGLAPVTLQAARQE